MQRFIVAVFGSCAFLMAASAFGQAAPIQVLVLGTYHMDTPGQDLVNVQAAALGALRQHAGRLVADFGARQAQSTVAELLRLANDERSLADASMYCALLGLDAGEDQPGDRVIVLFGAGHKHWLEQIARNTPGFEVVDATRYLPAR